MGNEDQVKKDIVESKSAFLREQLDAAGSKGQIYSLEQEFAKTKQNKSFMLYLILILILGLIGFGAWVLTSIVEKRASQVNIEISEFEDINLQEILSSSQDLQTQLRLKKLELEEVQKEMNQEIIAVKEETAHELELLMAEGLSPSEQSEKVAAINAEEDEEIAAVEESYQEQIAALEEEISAIESEVQEYELMAMDVADRQQQIENNYEKLYELRLAELEETYEGKLENLEDEYDRKTSAMKARYAELKELLILKYNPDFDISQTVADGSENVATAETAEYYLDNVESFFADEEFSPYDYVSLLNDEGVMNNTAFRRLHTRVEIQTVLLGRLREVPYINSVEPTLNYMHYLNTAAYQGYEDLWYNLINVVEAKNRIIDRYLFALETYSEENRDSGYILDNRDTGDMAVFIREVYTIPDSGTEAYVFREDDELIGSIRVYPDENGHRAELIELEGAETIQPFDNILLRLQGVSFNAEATADETQNEEETE